MQFRNVALFEDPDNLPGGGEPPELASVVEAGLRELEVAAPA